MQIFVVQGRSLVEKNATFCANFRNCDWWTRWKVNIIVRLPSLRLIWLYSWRAGSSERHPARARMVAKNKERLFLTRTDKFAGKERTGQDQAITLKSLGKYRKILWLISEWKRTAVCWGRNTNFAVRSGYRTQYWNIHVKLCRIDYFAAWKISCQTRKHF